MANFLSTISTAVRRSMMYPVDIRSGWSNIIREPTTGAWQRNEEISVDTATAQHAVYTCITRIASDIGKLRPTLVQMTKDGIWAPYEAPAFSPVLRKPNRYQNSIQFGEWWATSKLMRGNTYALKQRDGRNVVVALYILDPDRVTPMVADDGSVWYQLGADNLSGVPTGGLLVPASEIIHDRMNCLFHPLVGISPLYASALAASQGLNIQKDSASFFANGSRPGGILTAPGNISDANAARLKDYFDNNFAGSNRGKVAVLGDDLKYTSLRMTSTEAQLIEQLGWTSTVVCSTFHVPPFKVHLGPIPTGMKVGDINLIYFADCLQSLIEQMEACLDEGLSLPPSIETRFDIDGLSRMDPLMQADILSKYVGGAIMAPNEARARVQLSPIEGGDSVYLQQQNYSLEALAKRDAAGPPKSKLDEQTPTPAPVDEARELIELIQKGLADV